MVKHERCFLCGQLIDGYYHPIDDCPHVTEKDFMEGKI